MRSLIDRLTGRRDRPAGTDNDVFCIAPFIQQYVGVNGEVMPCCVSAHHLDEALGNLKDGDTLETAWNSERSRALRQRMVNGEKSTMCSVCYDWEDVGKESSRQIINRQFAHHLKLVQELAPDGSLPHDRVVYLDIRLSNLCNFKCRICSPYFSSSWHADARKMGRLDPQYEKRVYPAEDLEAFLDQVLPLLDGIEKIHFAGGEPLIIGNHYRILEHLVEHGMTDVELSYNTNFSKLTHRSHDAIEYWKEFEKVVVCASLDGAGARGEFMRTGQKWDAVVRERRRMIEECPHAYFEINPAVGIMNVWHLPDFYREWVDAGLMKPDQINIFFVFEPECYDMRRLPPHLKDRVEAKYRDFIDGYLKGLGRRGQRATDLFESTLRQMRSKDLPMLDEFFSYNAELDGIRGEDMQTVFPELADLWADHTPHG